MRKLNKILMTSLLAVTTVCGVSCGNKAAKKVAVEEFKVTADVDFAEAMGKKVLTDEGTVIEGFTTGTTTDLVSPVAAQVLTDEETETKNIRFVAAVKATVDGDSVTLPGEIGFHIAYEKNHALLNKCYTVDTAYLSINAGASIYKSELSHVEVEGAKTVADFLPVVGLDAAAEGYNAFVALEIQNIPLDMLDTLFQVETYVKDEAGNRTVSEKSKRANATGRASYFAVINDGTPVEMKYNEGNDKGNEYYKSFELAAGDKYYVVDSLGRVSKDIENLVVNEEGYFVAPFDAKYTCYYKEANYAEEAKRNKTYIGVSNYPDDIVVLHTNGNWESANQRFAVYFFEDDYNNTWRDMTKFGDRLYYVNKVEGYGKGICVRLNGETTENKWDNKWNQTDDIDLSTGNFCEITGWDKSSTFSKK